VPVQTQDERQKAANSRSRTMQLQRAVFEAGRDVFRTVDYGTAEQVVAVAAARLAELRSRFPEEIERLVPAREAS
jgi:hypothetical protein